MRKYDQQDALINFYINLLSIAKENKKGFDKSKQDKNSCCCNHKQNDHKKGNTRASAFRAVNLTNQTVPGTNTFVKVLYQFEEFDIANEYNPANSAFIPKTNGVYSIIATIAFIPSSALDYRAGLQIRVNGNPVAADNDFFGAGQIFSNEITVSTILELEAGDQVEIFAVSNLAGVIAQNGVNQNSTHFEAARFPSPVK